MTAGRSPWWRLAVWSCLFLSQHTVWTLQILHHVPGAPGVVNGTWVVTEHCKNPHPQNSVYISLMYASCSALARLASRAPALLQRLPSLPLQEPFFLPSMPTHLGPLIRGPRH
jgi:hypothetical protein